MPIEPTKVLSPLTDKLLAPPVLVIDGLLTPILVIVRVPSATLVTEAPISKIAEPFKFRLAPVPKVVVADEAKRKVPELTVTFVMAFDVEERANIPLLSLPRINEAPDPVIAPAIVAV